MANRKSNKQPDKLLELAVDVAKFTRKWTTPKMANAIGLTKQGLEYHVDKDDKYEN